MSDLENKPKTSRRSFLKGTAVSLASGLAFSLTSCAQQDTPEEANPAPESATLPSEEKWPFEIPPEPISDKDIEETLSADVVVLGAGISGVCAALSASRAGAKVVLLEKRETCTFHAGWVGAIGSRLQESLNVEINTAEVINDMMRWGAGIPDPSLLKVWASESGRIMNQLLDLTDDEVILEQDLKEPGLYKYYNTSHRFQPAWNATLVPMIEQAAIKAGAQILYETPAVQLIREENGPVTGVIGKGLDGYIRVDAPAVIICTGGYGGNKEMQKKYEPRALKAITNWYGEGSNTGDGIMMGMWVGATKQEFGSCPMLFDGGSSLGYTNLTRQPWLNVNLNGKRYANEDAPFGYTCNQDIQQPGGEKWVIWDAKWDEEKSRFHGTVCERMVPPSWNEGDLETWVERGFIITADTLEELADLMQVPSSTFLSTVDRYNELTHGGCDLDFGKNPEMLTTIEKAPFYAVKTGTAMLVTLDGLQINTQMQVLDNEKAAIPGLYAAGNASGNFFANDYPISITGVSHGRAMTFGWLAGEIAAAQKA